MSSCRSRPSPSSRFAALFAAAWAACAAPAFAQETAPAPPSAPVPAGTRSAPEPEPGLPLWELGLVGFGLSQQAYPGSSERVDRVLPLPFAIYRGAILRADRTGAGVRAIRTESFEFDIGVAAAFGSSSSDVDVRRGMPDLGTLIEIGPRVKWHLGEGPLDEGFRLELPVRGVFDVSDGMANRGIAVEPGVVYEREAVGRWNWRVGGAAIFGDSRLADTFYGVAPVYATATRPAYEAEAGLIAWRLTGAFSRNLDRDLRLFGFARITSVQGAANAASPLVDRTTGVSAGIGLAWTLFRSGRAAAD